MEERIKRELRESMLVKQSMLERNVPEIMQLANMVIHAYKNGGRLIAFGNGGSAADAQHIVAELVNYQYNTSRPMLDALALTVNTSVITAIGNDIGYDSIFSKQIESLATEKDVVMGITTSGNSENVIKGLKKAKERGAKCIALVGKGGGRAKNLDLDIMININSDDTARIQEGHITIGHIMCSLVEKELFQNAEITFAEEDAIKVIAKAPVRISFANGGDTDTYIEMLGNGCVVNATLASHYYECSLAPKETEYILVTVKNLYEGERIQYEIKDLEGKKDLIRTTVKRIYPEFKGDIIIKTNVPLTSGMGGSSALMVALIKALYTLKGKEVSPEKVARLAYDIERNDMGIKGGYQDQWAASYGGGINFMEFFLDGVKVQNLDLSEETLHALEESIILFYVEPRMATGSNIHEDQKKQIKYNLEEIKQILKEKRLNTLQIKEALVQNNLNFFGNLLHKDFILKKKLSTKVSTPFIDEVYEKALQHGALGGRISGAGAGGCAIFYCPKEKKEGVIQALKQKGGVHLPFTFERKQ